MKIFGEKKENVKYISRPGAYIIFLNPKHEIATIKTSKGLFLPGGGKINNETDEECLERELFEELGWKIEIGFFLGKNIQYYNSTRIFLKLECNFYLGESFLKVSETVEEDHILKWFPFDLLIKNLKGDNQKWAIKEAFKYKKKSKISKLNSKFC